MGYSSLIDKDCGSSIIKIFWVTAAERSEKRLRRTKLLRNNDVIDAVLHIKTLCHASSHLVQTQQEPSVSPGQSQTNLWHHQTGKALCVWTRCVRDTDRVSVSDEQGIKSDRNVTSNQQHQGCSCKPPTAHHQRKPCAVQSTHCGRLSSVTFNKCFLLLQLSLSVCSQKDFRAQAAGRCLHRTVFCLCL